MSTRINHNLLSLAAQRSIHNTQISLDRAVERLSSGLRINNSWDDPAGLAISERFRAQIASMTEAERNANYNINLLSTAEGALSSIDNQLIRMRAISVQASNGALLSSDREALNIEFQHLKSEITRVANSTNYAGIFLLDGSYSAVNTNGHKFHIGTYNVNNQDYYYVTIDQMNASALGLTSTDLLTTTSAQAAIGTLDAAIQSKDTARTKLGAEVNRLQNTILNLQISRENATASESQIRDADIAAEMSEFVRSQILMQSGIAMLSQANMLPQMIAGLVG